MDRIGFETVDEATWRAAVEAALAKGQAARGPNAPPKTLDSLSGVTPEGLKIEPLYTQGPAGESSSAVRASWPHRALVAQHLDATGPDVASEIRDATSSGVEVLWLGADTLSDVERALKGDHATKVPILLDAGTRAARLAEAARELGCSHVSAMFDPFGAALRRAGLDVPLEGALDQAGALVRDAVDAQRPFTPRALALSAADVIDAGGAASHAIGYVLAGAAELARRLDARGLDKAKISEQIAVVVAPGTEVYYGIALLRALRVGWGKLFTALGVDTPGAPLVVGTTSRRSMAELDRPNNMVRITIETFALLAGGADIVAPRPFDELSATGKASALGRRLAKNTAIVLQEESGLTLVPDPAAGSYFIDSLTDQIARAGWEELRRIEREGGIVTSLSAGMFQRRVEEARKKRLDEIARRKRVLVGVNDFAAPSEALPGAPPEDDDAQGTRTWPIRALGAERDSEPFELLRLLVRGAGKPRRAVLSIVGDASKARARVGFTRRFFEVAGFDVTEESVDPASEVFVVCGTDDAYVDRGAGAVRAARAAGARAVVLAGKPGKLAEPLAEAGLTDAIYEGVDVLSVLRAILSRTARPL